MIISYSSHIILTFIDIHVVGLIYSEAGTVDDVDILQSYVESVASIRDKPSITSIFPRLRLSAASFFHKRYGSTVAKLVDPASHGDTFNARSSKNILFGDFLAATMFGFIDGTSSVDPKANFFGDIDNADWVQTISPDTLNVLSNTESPVWVGQKASDAVNGSVKNIKPEPFVVDGMKKLFDEQALAKRIKEDLFMYPVSYNVDSEVGKRPYCITDLPGLSSLSSLTQISSIHLDSSYIPSHTLSPYIPGMPEVIQSGPRAVSSQQLFRKKRELRGDPRRRDSLSTRLLASHKYDNRFEKLNPGDTETYLLRKRASG